MQFTLSGGQPLDLEDLALQMRQGVPVTYESEKVGRTIDATPKPNSLRVVIELFTPTELPLIRNLRLRATPKNPTVKLGTSLIVHAVEAKTEEG